MHGRPFERGLEQGSAVQQIGVAILREPLRRSTIDPLPRSQIVPGLLDPVPKTGPTPKERFVRDLEGIAVDRQQPGVHHLVDHPRADLGIRIAVQVAGLQTAARVGRALPRGHESEHEAAARLLLRVVEHGLVERVRGLGDGPGDATGLAVSRKRQGLTVPAPPGFGHRVRHERECSQFAPSILEHRVCQPVLEAKPRPECGLFDHVLQVGQAHRPDQHLVGRDPVGEPRECRTDPVEIGAHRHHRAHAAGGGVHDGSKGLQEPLLGASLAEREQLLELIDHHQHPAAVAADQVGEPTRFVGPHERRRLVAFDVRPRDAVGELTKLVRELRRRIGSRREERNGPVIAP